MRNCFPTELAAGDTLSLTFESSDFLPADGWAFSLLLRGPTALELVGTPNGTAFDVELTVGESAGLTPGRYRWFAVYTFDSPAQRTTELDGHVDVSANPESLTGDQRSWAARKLAAIEAALLVRPDASSYSIGGRTYAFESHAEMMRIREALKREVAAEDGSNAAGAAVVLARFGRR